MLNFTSKKDLKKHITLMCDEIAQHIIPAAVHAHVFTMDKAEEALSKLADLRNAADTQLSVHFDKKPKDFPTPHEYRVARKAFFKEVYDKAHNEFHEGVDQLLGDLKS